MKRIFLFLAAAALAACATDQPKKPLAEKAAAGVTSEGEASPVGVIPTTLLHDAQRNKDLDVSIEYPTRGGPFPMIIFSHGYGSSPNAYEAMVSYWTSHGYVVIRPSHADANLFREPIPNVAADRRDQRQPSRRDRRRGSDQAQQPAQFRPNPAEQIWEKEREPQWRDRARDISLVIDSLPDLEVRFPELKGKIDRTKVGVGGHSYGGFTAMLVGGVRTSGTPPLQLGDPRVTAILVMSPQGIAANRGLTAESWRELKIPAMFMAGSRETGAAETETGDWRKGAYENSAAGDKYWVLIEGARYSSFAGGTAITAPEEDIIIPEGTIDPVTGQQVYTRMPRGGGTYVNDRGMTSRIRSIALTFWDAYLKNEAKAKERLSPSQYGGSVVLEKK